METKFFVTIAGLLVAGGLMMAVIHTVHRTGRNEIRNDWIKYVGFAYVVVTVLSTGLAGRWPLSFLLALVALASATELSRHLGGNIEGRAIDIIAATTLVAYCLSHLLFMDRIDWWTHFAFLFTLVAITDSFSQLWGRLIGRHKMCPKLSPNKTWEGFIGGMLTAAAGAWLFGFLLPTTPSSTLVAVGVVISLAAVAGDLLFSAIKRKLGIKDFSALLPGQGGLLDRFDSLIVAAPVFFWTSKILMQHGGQS